VAVRVARQGLRPGVLGLISDRELFIVGRIKDPLIVYGRNHSPDDIEATIQEITEAASRQYPSRMVTWRNLLSLSN
jgi:acyl-CoA synthetase (AMP-forming)/AMP-acid ligase II